ncbi:hypothetical protein [Arthrobacter sp. H35-D1]|uniref:hypothetical protein n=1 Tax=Arthrobacter sp. H35-D1 TaxID=3046202 RepID=UPI0024BA03E7|nr:hypothetical protein [Arthrobacter sp. H35-D1]MDJ0313297.1 hypothetical protein [Arthrobacter sp. H35-D1]
MALPRGSPVHFKGAQAAPAQGKLGAAAGGAAVLALATGVVLWRISECIFQSPREDDVAGLAALGLSFVLGALLCLRRRTG